MKVVYHNDGARIMPYEDGHLLSTVTSHWLNIPERDPPLSVTG
jgi:hypothetical protein